MNRILLYISLLFTCCSAFAQNTTKADSAKIAQQNDSIKGAIPLKVQYISDPLHNNRFPSIDTSLDGWQLTRPLFAEGLGRTFLGDANTASRQLVFSEKDFMSTNLSADPFSIYQAFPHTLKFYHGTRRFTEIVFNRGPEKDQRVQISYGQALAKRLFVGFDYNRAASLGHFSRQETGFSNTDLWLSYYTKNSRYRIFADGIWNRYSSQDNGGLKNFTDNQQSQTLPVNLQAAETRTRATHFNVIQFWSPSFIRTKSNDTTDQNHFNSYTNILPFRFFLATNYSKNTYAYSDQKLNGDYYEHFYFNTTTTEDTIISENFSNRLGLKGSIGATADTGIEATQFEASVNYEVYRWEQGDKNFTQPFISAKYNDLAVSAKLYKEKSSNKTGLMNGRPFWNLSSTYFLDGRKSGDYSADARIGYAFSKLYAIDLHGGSYLSTPTLSEETYISNNFIWANDFKKRDIKKAGTTISSFKYKFDITADYFLLNDFIYFNEEALPEQVDKQKLLSVNLVDRIKWRHWHLLTKVIYQKAEGNDVLRLPEWQTYNSLYYENRFFKNALFAQIGVDWRYVSAYWGNAYMPATRTFYIQNNQRVGGYRTADVFVNFQIKAARLFLKFENIIWLSGNNTKYYIPGAPVIPFGLRFGIWIRFFDL